MKLTHVTEFGVSYDNQKGRKPKSKMAAIFQDGRQRTWLFQDNHQLGSYKTDYFTYTRGNFVTPIKSHFYKRFGDKFIMKNPIWRPRWPPISNFALSLRLIKVETQKKY